MNHVDKELLIRKRFMNKEEQINIVEIQLTAMVEATVFAAAIMESSKDYSMALEKLTAILLKTQFLSIENKRPHAHLFVQRCFKDSRARGELDGFYVASLHEKTLREYENYFSLFLLKLVSAMTEAQKSVKAHRGFEDLVYQNMPIDIPTHYNLINFEMEED